MFENFCERIETFACDVIFNAFYKNKEHSWRFVYKGNEVRFYKGRILYCILYADINNYTVSFDKELSEYDSWFAHLIEEYFKNFLKTLDKRNKL